MIYHSNKIILSLQSSLATKMHRICPKTCQLAFPRSSRELVHFSAICDWAGNAIAALIAARIILQHENLCHTVLSYQNVNSFVYIRHTTQFSLTSVLPGVAQVGTSPLYAHGRWAGAVEPRGLVRPGREAPKPAKKGYRSC